MDSTSTAFPTTPAIDVVAIASENRDRMYRHALRLTRNTEDAEDVVQSALLKVVLKSDSFRAESDPMGWVYRITANEAYNLFRARRRRPAVSLNTLCKGGDDGDAAAFDIPDQDPAAEDNLDRAEQSIRLKAAIRALPDTARSTLEIADLAGVNYTHAAYLLRISPAGFKTRRHRARRMLATRLGAASDPRRAA